MKNNQNKELIPEIKEVDCILIFMLDEEKNLFLENNRDFFLTGESIAGFTEFYFFDKSNLRRTGVMCSNGKGMGNTEACKLFYKLSRHFSASLYINLGVVGHVDDVNVGDVILVDRLSTSGERNDNISKTQIQDYTNLNAEKIKSLCFDINQKVNSRNRFVKSTTSRVKEFKSKLPKEIIEKYDGFDSFEYNKIVTGWCLTVSQVIKDKTKNDAIKDQRKLNIIDMEAYYLASWYDYIKEFEPHIMQSDSSFLIFKSVSDYGDAHKRNFEKAGSRTLAMHNLYTVVSNYCTDIHTFSLPTTISLNAFFSTTVCENCIDPLASNPFVDKSDIEKLFQYIIHMDDSNSNSINLEFSITSILEQLNKDGQALLLTGRSGTGKSTYISFLYKEATGNKVLIDFSKYSDSDGLILVNLLERLINISNKVLVFLDGVMPQSKTYEAIKNVLNICEKNNVAFCIGNFDESIDSISTVLSAKENFYNIYFGGVNLYSHCFEKFISEWINFCEKIQYTPQDPMQIIFLLKNAKFNSVDLRLLKMFANYRKDLPKEKLPIFIRSYIISKHSEKNLLDYWKRYLYSNQFYKVTDKNQYYNSVAITNGIIELFKDSNFSMTDDIEAFIKTDFILSDDMNLILEYNLKHRKIGNIVIDNIIKLLENKMPDYPKKYKINISVETQLIYNVCRVIDGKDVKFSIFKKHINKMVTGLQKDFRNYSCTDISKFIKYRTLCVVEALCFSSNEYLEQFNNEMLTEKSGFLDYNLIFYLLYYSKREFSFSEVVNFNIENTDYEMFCNSFYALKNILYSEDIGSVVGAFLQCLPYTVISLITFLNLIGRIQLDNGRFADFLPESRMIMETLQRGLEIAMSRIDERRKSAVLNDLKKRLDYLISIVENQENS